METILAYRGQDFVMMAADTMHIKAAFIIADKNKKIHQVTSNSVMGVVGDGKSAVQFTKYILRSLRLYKISNRYDLRTKNAVHFIRKILASYAHANPLFRVAIFVAGFEPTTGPELYYLTLPGTSLEMPYGGHGLGAIFCVPILAQHYNANLNQEGVYKVFEQCVSELHKRLVINLRNFAVYVIDKRGVTEMECINLNNIAQHRLPIDPNFFYPSVHKM
ncbi:hypothetical protein KR018_008076 [Drosophila ironensis]|nr:hypothetical protein KR018_008076 [Drosophila ironensis]